MTVEPPENEVPDLVKLEAGIAFYARGTLTLGQAASLAGISQAQFLHELGRRKLCVNYSLEDFEHDLQTIKALHPELSSK